MDDCVLSARGVRVLDYAERAGWTAGQQLLAVLLATGGATSATGVVSLPWEIALLSALGAALISVATTWLLHASDAVERWSERRGFWGDVAERVVKTFVASLVGSLVALQTVDQAQPHAWWGALQLAVLTTLASLGKGLLARGSSPVGSGGNPSTLSSDAYAAARSRPADRAPRDRARRDRAPRDRGAGPPA